jgi:hypothetical protein
VSLAPNTNSKSQIPNKFKNWRGDGGKFCSSVQVPSAAPPGRNFIGRVTVAAPAQRDCHRLISLVPPGQR